MRRHWIAILTVGAVLLLGGSLRAQPPYGIGPGGPPPGAGIPPGTMMVGPDGALCGPGGPGMVPGMGPGVYPGEAYPTGGMYPGMDPGGMYPGMDPVYAGGPMPERQGIFDRSRDPAANRIWSIGVGGMLMKRPTARPQALIRAGAFTLTGPQRLGTEDLKFDYEATPRVNVIIHRESGLDFGFDYYDMENWRSEAVFSNNGNAISLSSPNIVLNSAVLTAGRFVYESNMWSAAFNVRWRLMPRVTLLAGLRFMEMTDDFLAEGNFPMANTFMSPFYTIRMENELAGPQIGILGTLFQAGPFSLDGSFVMGFLRNESTHTINDIFPVALGGPLGNLGSITASANRDTTVVEIGLTASMRLGDNVRIWLGYQFMAMNGMATAPSQIAGNDLYALGAGTLPLGPPGALGVDNGENLRFDSATGGIEVGF